MLFPWSGMRVTVIAAIAPAAGQDFYKGRSIDFLIAGNVGAGYDTYARTLLRHLGRHIPGEPTFVARNMPGAGGAIAAAWLANVAPRDGSTIGGIYPGAGSPAFTRSDRRSE